jgi:hypothetical protein
MFPKREMYNLIMLEYAAMWNTAAVKSKSFKGSLKLQKKLIQC